MNHSWLLLPLLLVLSAPASAQMVGTFTLDGLSFISFGDREVLHLPAGSTLEFRFGEPRSDGSVPFTIDPSGVSIADVALPSGGVLRYGIVSKASGTMAPTAEGRRVRFTATVRASLDRGHPSDGSYDYEIPFTTEATAAPNRTGTKTVSTTGMRLVEGVWYGQLVGATTNKSNAVPEPGAAVYTVLSGTFDRVP